MPLVTLSQALYGQSTVSFASDISVLCRISGVSAPVPILTKAGQNLLLTSIHIGDDERGFNRDPSTIADASLSKHTFGAGATVIGGGGDDFNPNVGTLTYWGGLAAESKLIVFGKSSHPMNPQQSTSGLRTGDIVLLLHVSQRVWMNKTTLQVREGQSKIYVLSRQDERMRQRLGRERRIQIGSERDDNDEVHLTIDQRKELRSLLSPADARFLLDDVAGNQRIQRLFALARREEPINTTAALLQQSLRTGKGGREGGGGSLAYVGMSTQLDGGFSEDPNPFVRRSREGGAEESQILPFDIDSSGATRAMSLQQSAPVRPSYAKTPVAPINSASISSPLITSCGKVPLATGIMFNISCSIRSFIRSALPVQSTGGILPAPPVSGSVGVVSASRGGQPLHQHSLVELGRASLVLPQSRSQPLVLIIAYSTDPHSPLINGVNVSAPTPTLAEHLCDLFFKSFSGKEKVIISNCLQRDGFIYLTSLSDVMSDSYDEDEEAFNMAHAASQRLAKQQLQLQESNSRKRPRDVSPRGFGAVHAVVAPSVNSDPDVVGIVRNMSRSIQGLFSVTSIYLPALQLGVQLEVQGLERRMTGQDIESHFTDLSSLPIDVDNTNDETLGRLALCNLLTLDSLTAKIAYLTTFLTSKRRKEENVSSALSND